MGSSLFSSAFLGQLRPPWPPWTHHPFFSVKGDHWILSGFPLSASQLSPGKTLGQRSSSFCLFTISQISLSFIAWCPVSLKLLSCIFSYFRGYFKPLVFIPTGSRTQNWGFKFIKYWYQIGKESKFDIIYCDSAQVCDYWSKIWMITKNGRGWYFLNMFYFIHNKENKEDVSIKGIWVYPLLLFSQLLWSINPPLSYIKGVTG